MGTRFELVLADEDSSCRLRAAGEAALDEIERIEGLLSLYQPDSCIADLNAHAADAPVTAHPEVFALVERAIDLCRATAGAFDITLLPLLKAWGFIGGSGHSPDPAELEAARALVGPEHVILNPETQTVRFDRRGVGVDLGAIGKGYALDAAARLLHDDGIENALIHGGTSTVVALGHPTGADAWTVAIRDPDAEDGALATVALSDGLALSVSGVHGKFFTGQDGRVYGHVLDPRSGEPGRSARLAAIVMPTATEADALSTALLVVGQEGASQIPALAGRANHFWVLPTAP